MEDEHIHPNTKKVLDYLQSRGYEFTSVERNGKTFFKNPRNWAEKANNFIESLPRSRMAMIIFGIFLITFIINYASIAISLYQHNLLSYFSFVDLVDAVFYNRFAYFLYLIILLITTFIVISISTFFTRQMDIKEASLVSTIMLVLLAAIFFSVTKVIYEIATTNGLSIRASTLVSDVFKKDRYRMQDLEFNDKTNFVSYKPIFYTFNKMVITHDENSSRYYILSRDPETNGGPYKLLAVANTHFGVTSK